MCVRACDVISQKRLNAGKVGYHGDGVVESIWTDTEEAEKIC